MLHATAPSRRAPSESAATPGHADRHRFAGEARRVQALAGLGLDADHPLAACEPRGLAGGEPAAAAGDEHRVEPVDLLLQLAAHRALAGHHVGMVERVHGERAGASLVLGGRGLGVVVEAVDDVHGGAERGDAVALHRRAAGRHEHLGVDAERAADERDRGTVVAAAGRHDAGRGYLSSAASTRLKAPRGLKLPTCCSSSSFSVSGTGRSSSPAATCMTGVTRTLLAQACSGGFDVVGGDHAVSPHCVEPHSSGGAHADASVNEPSGDRVRTHTLALRQSGSVTMAQPRRCSAPMVSGITSPWLHSHRPSGSSPSSVKRALEARLLGESFVGRGPAPRSARPAAAASACSARTGC